MKFATEYYIRMKQLEIYIDGASKGNPGPSGIGVIIMQGGQIIENIATYIGNTTNNAAEYNALIFALQAAIKLNAKSVKINSDSQLLCRQINKVYKVKHPNMIGLYNQVLHLMSAFEQFSIVNIPREENKGADKLADKAIKEYFKESKGR